MKSGPNMISLPNRGGRWAAVLLEEAGSAVYVDWSDSPVKSMTGVLFALSAASFLGSPADGLDDDCSEMETFNTGTSRKEGFVCSSLLVKSRVCECRGCRCCWLRRERLGEV